MSDPYPARAAPPTSSGRSTPRRIRRSPRRTASLSPIVSATSSRWTTCVAVVNSATSMSPSAIARHAAAKRPQILGQRPLIDGHARHDGARALEARQQIGVRCAVFLHGTRRPCERQLARFGCRATPAARARCLAPARSARPAPAARAAPRRASARARRSWCAATRRRSCRAAADLLDEPRQRPRADAGQQDDQIELAALEAVGKRDRFGVGLERHLAHRRRRDRLPAVGRDERGHLPRAPAFEHQHAQTVKKAPGSRRLIVTEAPGTLQASPSTALGALSNVEACRATPVDR